LNKIIPDSDASGIHQMLLDGAQLLDIIKLYGDVRNRSQIHVVTDYLRRVGIDYKKILKGRQTLRKNTRVEYRVYWAMLQRCYNPKNPNYPNWGGRGVTVCERWLGKGGFEKFYHDLGPRPSGKKNGRSLWSIHRKDGAMVYSPDTVKWADMTEQASNGRRNHWAIKRQT